MSVRSLVSGRRASGRLAPPPSKSLSNRYLNLALLSQRSIRIERLLEAEDTEAFLTALCRLGWRVETHGETTALVHGPPPSAAEISCGASGTMLRFLAASLSVFPGRWRLDGTARLRERPLGPLVEALRALGALVECPAAEGFAPLEIGGTVLPGGVVELDAGESSQFASALMMAASRARGPVEVSLSGLTSDPYLEITADALEVFGGRVEHVGREGFRVVPGLPARGGSMPEAIRVEGDYSSAAYWAAGAALVGGTVDLEGLSPHSRQGDRGFLEVLEAMGLVTEWRGATLRATGDGSLEAGDWDLSAVPDQVPTLAALAPFARGVTRIRNVPHLRLKESDRLAALARGLRLAGAEVVEEPDGLVIPGVWAHRPPPASPVTLDVADDHRIAMSFAILGLRRPGMSVSDAGVVAKSYPGFWRDLDLCFRP